MSWWSKFWNWITGGIGAIIAAIAIIVVTAVANIFTGGALTPILMGEIFGAIGGAAGAAATGGDIGRGMLMGTVIGGITGGVLGPGSAPAGAASSGSASAPLIIPTDLALSGIGIPNIVAVSEQAVMPAAMQAIITSGVGAGAAVINIIVPNAYAAENEINAVDAIDAIDTASKIAKTGRIIRTSENIQRAEAYYIQKAVVENGISKQYNDFVCEKGLNVHPWDSPLKTILQHNLEMWKWLQPKDFVSDSYGSEKLLAYDDARNYIVSDPDHIWGSPWRLVKDIAEIAY